MKCEKLTGPSDLSPVLRASMIIRAKPRSKLNASNSSKIAAESFAQYGARGRRSLKIEKAGTVLLIVTYLSLMAQE